GVWWFAATGANRQGGAPGGDHQGWAAAAKRVVGGRILMRPQPLEMARQHLPLETIEIVFRRSAGEANLLLDPDYRHVSDRPGRHRNLFSFPSAHRPKGQNALRSARLTHREANRSGHAIVTPDHS